MSSKVVEANAKIHSLAMAVAVSFFGFSGIGLLLLVGVDDISFICPVPLYNRPIFGVSCWVNG